MSNRARGRPASLRFAGGAIGRRYLCATRGEDKKKRVHSVRSACGRMHRNIAGSAAFECPRWMLEYPPGRGYEYAEVFYAILTRAPRFSAARLKIYDEAVHVAGGSLRKEKLEGKKRRRSPVIDGSKGPHRKIVDAHP